MRRCRESSNAERPMHSCGSATGQRASNNRGYFVQRALGRHHKSCQVQSVGQTPQLRGRPPHALDTMQSFLSDLKDLVEQEQNVSTLLVGYKTIARMVMIYSEYSIDPNSISRKNSTH